MHSLDLLINMNRSKSEYISEYNVKFAPTIVVKMTTLEPLSTEKDISNPV